MITIISPAKTLDFETVAPNVTSTVPDMLAASEKIVSKLQKLSAKKLATLMHINKDLAELNRERFATWSADFDSGVLKPALFAFSGEVYRGIEATSLKPDQLQFSQNHLRILSGLYGLLRPLDRIKPYRLEMGTSISVGRSKNLYAYWGKYITDALNSEVQNTENKVIINLASKECSKAIDFKRIKGRVITPEFKDFKNGEYKVVMTWAKNARGKMAGFILRNKITDPEQLKLFDAYKFDANQSSENEWVFTR